MCFLKRGTCFSLPDVPMACRPWLPLSLVKHFQTTGGDAKLGIRLGVAGFWSWGEATLSLKLFLSFCRGRKVVFA